MVMGNASAGMEKSPLLVPPMVMPEILKGAVPVLLKAMVTGLLATPTVWVPKLTLEGLMVNEGCTPWPVRLMVCGLPAELSASTSVADSLFMIEGVNTTFTGAEEPAAIVTGTGVGLLKSAAFAPLNEIVEITRFPVPVLLMVTVCGVLAWPTPCDPKLRTVGLADNTGEVPLPVSDTCCVPLPALSLMFKVATRWPVADGRKVTETVVLALTATVIGAGVVTTNSPANVAFVMLKLVIWRLAVPVLVMVTCRGTLVTLTPWSPKLRLVGFRVTAGAGATPVPFSDTVWGLFAASLLMIRFAVRCPLNCGVNVTLSVTLPPLAATVNGVVTPV